jgi:hypothetical protein
MSKDNICRLWVQSTNHHFHLALILNPMEFSLSTNDYLFHNDGDKYCTIHWLHKSEIQKAIEAQEFAEKKFLNKNVSHRHIRKNKRLHDVLKDYSDLLFSVGKDGSMTFWGIQVTIKCL